MELSDQVIELCQALAELEKSNVDFWISNMEPNPLPTLHDTQKQLMKNDMVLKNHIFTIHRVLKQKVTKD